MTLRFVTDENIRDPILQGLRRRLPDLDIVRVQDVGLRGADDPHILAWAAEERRVLVTHDAETMTDFAFHRVAVGLPMSGVIVIAFRTPIGQAIEALVLAIGASLDTDWDGQVRFLA